MDYIIQLQVVNPHDISSLLKPATKARLLYCNFETLNEKSKSKTHSQRGSNTLNIARSMFLSVSVLNTLNIFTDLKGPK